ncbi:MAG: type II secretion system F family protein [Candidatus Liptonbacteria bacterium]
MNKKLNFSIPAFHFFETVSTDDKINFARHLSIIIRAGLPLIEGLKIIRRQATGTLAKVIDHLIESVNSGQSLAHGLERYRHIFENFFISIISVGEVSGTLSQNLLYLSDELKKIKDLKGRVRSAMIYPIILFIATVAITVFLTFFIFPKIIEAFSQLNVKLPATTSALIAILGFLQNKGVLLAIAIVAAIITIRLLLRLSALRYIYHRAIMATPVLGTLTVNMNVASSARILSILLKSGVKIVDAVIIVSETFDNLVYRRAFKTAAENIRKGETLAEYLKNDSKSFPPMFSAMVEVGESTGNLEENLMYLSNYFTEEVDSSLKNLTAVLEPLMILGMGLIVGFVALSIITPIYSISQGLRQ